MVPGCPNRKDHCKWGLFLSDDVHGRKWRLCGSTLEKVSCGNTSPSCKSVSFHGLPKDVGGCAVLRKMCHSDEEYGSPLIFLGQPVISKHYTHASTKGDFHVTTSMPQLRSAANFSSEEHMSDVCSAMLTRHIDLESARNEKSKELKSTIKDQDKVTTGLETLLSESCVEVKKVVFCCQSLSCPCEFYVLHWRPHYLSPAK